jgi:ribose transport system ATP-binding protein
MVADLLVSGRGIAKSYGATQALKNVDITLRRGEVHALLGGNGAGKSTLIGILSQLIKFDSGNLEFHTRKMAVVHQELAIMPDLSVAENIALGSERRLVFPRNKAAGESRKVLDLLGLVDSEVGPETRAGDLKLHQLQLIEIGRALNSGAELILLDEPTASLTVEETDRLFEVLRSLKGHGIGFVLVSHRMHEIRQIADVVTVLRDGRTAVDAAPLAGIDDATIVAEMFAGQLAAEAAHPVLARSADAGPSQGQVKLRHIGTDIEVTLAPGQILGLAGTPQGPATLTDAFMGLSRTPEWEVSIAGKAWRPVSPRKAVRGGIGFISGDRALKGSFPDLSIRDNAVLARQVVQNRVLRRPREISEVQEQSASLGFNQVAVDDFPRSLSGGTLQKVLIARWLDLPLRVLLLEEPTRGVDLKTKTDLYRLIHTMADTGVIVIWWSTEHSELLAVSEKILAFTVTGHPHQLVATAETNETELLRITGTT